MTILFFDTETTGFRKDNFLPRILQIGALLTDGWNNTISELNIFLRPEGFESIPKEASAINKITMNMLNKYGVDRPDGLGILFDLIAASDLIVAHNIEFDVDMLGIEIDCFLGKQHLPGQGIMEGHARRWKQQLDSAKQFCTMRQSTDVIKLPPGDYHGKLYSQYKPPRLAEAYAYFFNNDTFDNAHNAMADVRACRDVYFALQKAGETP